MIKTSVWEVRYSFQEGNHWRHNDVLVLCDSVHRAIELVLAELEGRDGATIDSVLKRTMEEIVMDPSLRDGQGGDAAGQPSDAGRARR